MGLVMGALLDLPGKAKDFFVDQRIAEEFGWVAWLSQENLRTFRLELFEAMQSKLSEDAAAEFLDGWKATAELDHDPEALEQLERNQRSNRWSSVDEWMSGKRDIA
jgi:hypothetical protein